jgi:hypothetical protein
MYARRFDPLFSRLTALSKRRNCTQTIYGNQSDYQKLTSSNYFANWVLDLGYAKKRCHIAHTQNTRTLPASALYLLDHYSSRGMACYRLSSSFLTLATHIVCVSIQQSFYIDPIT